VADGLALAISILGVLVAALGVFVKPQAWIDKEKQRLRDRPDVRAEALLQATEERWFSSYRDYLERALAKLDA
jgi:hypothetical protein